MSAPHRRTAMEFLAAYGHERADDYERHVARIAHAWLEVIDADEPMQAVVDRLLEELAQPVPPDYGCAWEDLRTRFTAWALAEDYLEPGS